MDEQKLLNVYQNISREELEKMRRYDPGSEYLVRWLRKKREKVERKGREHVVSVPLVHVLSIRVLPDKVDENEPLVMYGRIYGECDHITHGTKIIYDIYNRGDDDPEIIGQSGNLTLIGPTDPYWQSDKFMQLNKTRIVVDVWDHVQNVVFVQESFFVEETTENDYEQVKLKVVRGPLGFVVVCYIAMPFATLYRLVVKFYRKGRNANKGNRFVNVNGKIVARYGNTYGNYSSEECIIFEKQTAEFERVEIHPAKDMRLSRYWIGLPAYSSLFIDLDLWDFDTKRKIIKQIVEFPTRKILDDYGDTFEVDDNIVINVGVGRSELCLQGAFKEESDSELEDQSSDEPSDDESSSNMSLVWAVRPHETKPMPSALVEFFSVFIGREKSKALRLFGVIEISFGDHIFYIFRRQDNNAMELLENEKTALILDGNREYNCNCTFKIKFDLKDVDGHLFIKGYVKWDSENLDAWSDVQLCSVIPGEQGFVAVHYTIFSFAVQAKIEICYKSKKGSCDVCTMVYGSVVAQYNNYDYSSRYKKDYYRSVLFERIYEDLLQLPKDGKLPLSRSIVVVPMHSSLVIEVDLWNVALSQGLSRVVKIEIGCCSIGLETEDFLVDINLKWSDSE